MVLFLFPIAECALYEAVERGYFRLEKGGLWENAERRTPEKGE